MEHHIGIPDSGARPAAISRLLVVIARNQPRLLDTFEAMYGQEPEVDIITDRRCIHPAPGPWHAGERRGPEPRDLALAEDGFILVAPGRTSSRVRR